MTFRELIRGCVNVLQWLVSQNIPVTGYLSHLSFMMDRAVLGNLYTTGGIALYERVVTTKVIDGSLED